MIGRTNSTFGGAISLPDGDTVTPVNDVQTWLKCAGIKDKTYTTVSQVVADTNTMFLLTSDENAMKYLARSTDFADTICADETSMTYLGQSAYVDSTVLNSDIWKQKIKASQYWEFVYTTVYNIHAGASEAITIDGVYGSFTTNADGTVNHALPLGELTLTGSVSGKSFTRTVMSGTTEVYVMPEGALYWYGNECTWITGGWTKSYSYNASYFGMEKTSKYIRVYNSSSSGSYIQGIATEKMINPVGKTKLKCISEPYSTTSSSESSYYSNSEIGLITSRSVDFLHASSAELAYLSIATDTLGIKTMEADISVSNNVYVGVEDNYPQAGDKIYGLWLE